MRRTFTGLLLTVVVMLQAQAPTGYYNAALGSTEATLKTKLCAIVGPHTERTYANLWTDFQSTDKRPDGKVCDIYSATTNYTFGTNQCGNYSGEGSCYNREHSFPKSWFNDATPMYTDLFHLYPSDGYVNGRRSNYPFGEVGTVSYSSNNNYCRLGSSSMAGYSGTVFEPADSLKGDFARTYFYMVTAYDDKVSTWVSDQLAGNQYPALSAWSVTLFLKWNSQDPVGSKERNRNEAVYKIQGNRNPFIDHPELAEFIWGSRKGEGWSLTTGVENPVLQFRVVYSSREGLLKIDTESATLQYALYSVNGQQMSSGAVDAGRTVKTGNLAAGMYLLKLTDGSKQGVTKFVAD